MKYKLKYLTVNKNYKIQPSDLPKVLRPPIIAPIVSQSASDLIYNYLKSNSVKRLTQIPRIYRDIAHRLIRNKELTLMRRIGLDVGTKNIVLAYRENDTIKFRKEINGFCRIERTDGIAKTTLKDLKIPYIMSSDGKALVALGSKAEEIAYTFGTSLRRPMERGVLSISEQEAMEIMAVIVRAMIGKVEQDTILYYCIPANAINEETNVEYHQKIVQLIIDGHNKIEPEVKLQAYPINEARALVLSQFEDKTGIGISWGSGMVNVSFCIYGLPVYEFSIVGAGDAIDYESARATGMLETLDGKVKKPKVLITKIKENINLNSQPHDNIERAIHINYQILVEHVAKEIVRGFKENEKQARAQKAINIVCAGGTSSPEGFIELFGSAFSKIEMPFEVGTIVKAPQPLYAIAEGCLYAAEAHDAGG